MKGCDYVKQFNLLDEPWISVVVDKKGNTENVSLIQVFTNAHRYSGLAGDTKTQDFAVLRVLLAVLHTVFSRFDEEGEVYEVLDLDEKWIPREEMVDEDDAKAYREAMYETWVNLWKKGLFPTVVEEYLEKWRDRFFLLDEEYPFFQVTKKDVDPTVIVSQRRNPANPTTILGRYINRQVSESGTNPNNIAKKALFSPKADKGRNKDKLTLSQIARWLITFQGYTGLADKAAFVEKDYRASKGWLYDIGGIYVEGGNLFKTLLLNCALVHPETQYHDKTQRPCWEFTSEEIINRYLQIGEINNLAELYTNWSRAIYIDPKEDYSDIFSLDIVKLPDITHEDQFLELMSLWRYNTRGPTKDKYTPRKHRANQAMWRSFGLITLSYHVLDKKDKNVPQRKPGIIDWINKIGKHVGNPTLTLNAISMQDDGNATSWVPVDEIYDVLNIREAVLTDVEEEGWIPRINDVVEETKTVIDWTFRNFLKELKEIRNMSSDGFVDREVEELYFLVDQPFREWISALQFTSDKDDRIFAWRETLKQLTLQKAQQILQQAGPRDYTGIMKEDGVQNIATAYNRFLYFLYRQ
jgi:CRISPR system Cascade subunit CasA